MVEILRLDEGGHLHLSDLMVDAPLPGSLDWLPIAEKVAAELEESSGRWVVKLPLGTTERLPVDPWRERPRWLPELGRILEPPSVVCCFRQHRSAVWEGENHRWQRLFGHRSLVVLSLSRSVIEAREGDPFVCEQLWEIQGPTLVD
jgi:hypothetical protein